MSRSEEAKRVLDLFLFEDVYNNNNFNEDEWGITFIGDEYALIHYESGEIYHFTVSITPGTSISPEVWHEEYKGQGWINE